MAIEFKGIGGTGAIGGLIPSGRASEKKAGEHAMGDKVVFSDILQEVNRAQEGQAVAESGRAEKVAALKAQVADGSYQPDLKQVAVSLVRFLEGR
ncbi:MAG: flagellar biosynthesis anti-sigma factor FlgM [Desulfobulbaceae bacterium]|jgi:negative regulator of flagellin synthesis FlgM|nr:flagellar biosynthesis anti-sigma factor FlgM [Desulfobulbaceae bacterium]